MTRLLAAMTPLLFMLLSTQARAEGEKSLQVAPAVDLNRYQGVWHEVARLPNRFQNKCARDTTATYTLRPDGKITVLNQCREASGKLTSAKGTAKLADSKGPNTKLRVSFFWPFYGNYWIIDLDPEYQWAVIGEPERKYFWILSRTPKLDQHVFDAITARAKQQGYDLSKLILAAQ